MSHDISCTESQIENLLIEWSQYNDSLDNEPSANETVNLVANDEALNRTIADFETILTSYVIQTTGAKKSKHFLPDFEAFVDAELVSIKILTESLSENERTMPKLRSYNFASAPLPFLIKDVLKIDSKGAFNSVRSMYGQQFKAVMFHGFSQWSGGRSNGEKNYKRYIVDDGTASIQILFDHETYQKGLRRKIEILRRDYSIAQKQGITGANLEVLPPQSEKCQKILRDIEIILAYIDRNNHVHRERFDDGVKLFVIGIPYWNEILNVVQVFAYHVYEDSGINRDMEINFKRHLSRLYTTKYLKFTRDGTPTE